MTRPGATSLRARLAWLTGCAVLSALLAGGFGVAGTLLAHRQTQTAIDDALGTAATVGELRSALEQMARYELDIIVNFESAPLTDAAKAQWSQALQRAREGSGALRDAAGAQGPIDTFLAGLAAYQEGFVSLMQRIEQGKVLSAGDGNQFMLPHRKPFGEASAALGSIEALAARSVRSQRDAAAQRGRGLVAAAAAAMALGALTALGVGIGTLRAITRPVDRAGAMSSRIAHGDLTEQPQVEGGAPAELAILLLGIADMRTSLRELALGMRSAATGVAAAATDIEGASRRLRDTTAQSALALDETRGTVRRIDEMARQSAADAGHVTQLARAAMQSSRVGTAAVREAVQSMSGITEMARRVGEISVVIDGMAHQTNILAINAAVEAAHAGPVGKGFAVVADEVRGLAGNSARSALEIRELIATTQQRVTCGATAVEQAGATMEGVGDAIEQVAARITRIADLAAQQSGLIADAVQRTEAVNQLTQHNAALAEQSASAAEALQAHAARLQGMVLQFKV